MTEIALIPIKNDPADRHDVYRDGVHLGYVKRPIFEYDSYHFWIDGFVPNELVKEFFAGRLKQLPKKEAVRELIAAYDKFKPRMIPAYDYLLRSVIENK